MNAFILAVPLVFFAFIIAATIFWIWMLVDAITNPGLGTGEKIGWVIAIIFLHALGALLYFVVGHGKRNSPVIG